VCPAHLKDRGFCSPIIDQDAIAAKKKKEMDEEVERLKKEYEEKQRKKKEKEAKKEKEKDKGKEEDKKDTKEKNEDKNENKKDVAVDDEVHHPLSQKVYSTDNSGGQVREQDPAER
jgi:hypothetical protein